MLKTRRDQSCEGLDLILGDGEPMVVHPDPATDGERDSEGRVVAKGCECIVHYRASERDIREGQV